MQKLNEKRETLFADWKKANRDQDDRFSEALIQGLAVSEESIPFPPFCGGPERYYAVGEDIALAVIELDWRKSNRDLKAAFERLLARRPKHPLIRGEKPKKGGRGGASDQLKKLGARRLRMYYGSAEAAVEAIESAFSNTRDKPPYCLSE